ncbi:hypothetical protein OBBRIDRAFT_808323 [Obba rivulosa]|uniref:Uncharacterized protein n=1 Tax=Obba rivulosa TaxID=1052685 RepID=A0A8E2DE10_9APHY|nr:hypothetical protein OBBRIDRAFT_808323 [Obba rivulosa]
MVLNLMAKQVPMSTMNNVKGQVTGKQLCRSLGHLHILANLLWMLDRPLFMHMSLGSSIQYDGSFGAYGGGEFNVPLDGYFALYGGDRAQSKTNTIWVCGSWSVDDRGRTVGGKKSSKAPEVDISVVKGWHEYDQILSKMHTLAMGTHKLNGKVIKDPTVVADLLLELLFLITSVSFYEPLFQIAPCRSLPVLIISAKPAPSSEINPNVPNRPDLLPADSICLYLWHSVCKPILECLCVHPHCTLLVGEVEECLMHLARSLFRDWVAKDKKGTVEPAPYKGDRHGDASKK